MLTIDGSFGEGGGQILRSSLALSLITGTPFRIENIRAGRSKPGLLRQHLTAVTAAARIGRAEMVGAVLGSQELLFRPGEVVPGSYRFDIGSAGSTTLVLQAVLPPLLLARGSSSLILEGGTHNSGAPPFDYLARVFLPLVNRMGPRVTATLERPGFYPAGGGRFVVSIEPAARLARLDLPTRGELRACRARAVVAHLPLNIAKRELKVVEEKLGWQRRSLEAEEAPASAGPGNILTLEVRSAHITELFTGFGERGVPAETVAERAVEEAQRYLAAEVPVGEHLADQLLLPLALGGGSMRTLPLTLHTTTNIEVVQKFLEVEVTTAEATQNVWEIQVSPAQ